jgi:hypothetical protein
VVDAHRRRRVAGYVLDGVARIGTAQKRSAGRLEVPRSRRSRRAPLAGALGRFRDPWAGRFGAHHALIRHTLVLMEDFLIGLLDAAARGTRTADTLGWPNDMRRIAQASEIGSELGRQFADRVLLPPPALSRSEAHPRTVATGRWRPT